MNRPMRVLVLGHTGMLGTALVPALHGQGLQVCTLERPQLDARQPDLAALALSEVDAVVNAVGLINRRMNQPELDFVRVNSLFPRLLADGCAQAGVPLIHISTDCVFDGQCGPYAEDASAWSQDLYGRSKREGEPRNAMVLRTSIVGPERHNHYALLCWLMRQPGPVPGFVNHHWNGVTTLALGQAIGRILLQRRWASGVFHIHGEDLSKYDLLVAMQQAFGLDLQVVPTEDTAPRDTRLRSLHPGWPGWLNLPPMKEQLAALRPHCDARGYWVDTPITP